MAAATARVRVRLDERGRLLARVDVPGVSLAVKAVEGAGSLAAEAAAQRELHAAALVADLDGDPHVLVSRWAHGRPLTSSEPRGAARQVGQVLSAVHRLPARGPAADLAWVARLDSRVPDLAVWWASVAPDADPELLLYCWAGLRPVVLAGPRTRVLRDARPDHWLVRHGRLNALIDVADLADGDPAEDLAVLAVRDESLLPSVLRGHRLPAGRLDRAYLQAVLPFYLAVRRLSAAQWQTEHGVRPDEVPALLAAARAAVLQTGAPGRPTRT